MEVLVELDCLGKVILVDAGFDDTIDGGSGDVSFRFFEFFENPESFIGPEGELS